jgi:hypothetical protein
MTKYNKKEEREELEKEIKFELDFYSYLAKTENFEILTLPLDLDGNRLTPEQVATIADSCKKDNVTLLYRVSYDKIALIFTEDMNIIGVVPEYDSRGFPC